MQQHARRKDKDTKPYTNQGIILLKTLLKTVQVPHRVS